MYGDSILLQNQGYPKVLLRIWHQDILESFIVSLSSPSTFWDCRMKLLLVTKRPQTITDPFSPFRLVYICSSRLA